MALSDNMKGAALMAVAMSAFTLNDVCMKAMSGDIPLMQAIFLRGAVVSVLIAALAWHRNALRLPPDRRDRVLIAVRCLAEAAAAWFFLTALMNMPIANITAILQALPLAVTLGSAVFLREPVGWRRWLAIGIGFAGVLLIVRPGPEGFSLYAIYGIATVVCASIRDLVTRQLSRSVPTLSVTLFTAIAVSIFAFVAGWAEDWIQPAAPTWGLLALASGFIFLAYLFIIEAMRVGEIGFVAPFRYAGMLVALILGFVVFGEWPEWPTLLGAAVLVGTGLYTLHRERVQNRLMRRGLAVRGGR